MVKPLSGVVDVAAGDDPVVTWTLPALPRGGQYRIDATITQDGDEAPQQLHRRLVCEVTDGPRRELILDDSPNWQHMAVTELTDSLPAEGEWKDGRTSYTSFTKALGEDVKAVWYRTQFEAPDWPAGQYSEIYFGEAGLACQVYLNGQHVASHVGPFYPFRVVVTGVLKPGEPNVLAVRVQDNRYTNRDLDEVFIDPVISRMAPHAPAAFNPQAGRLLWPMKSYPPTVFGVTGMVRVRMRPAVHIDDVFVMTSVKDKRLTCRVRVANTSDDAAAVKLDNAVYEGHRKVLDLRARKVTIEAGQTVTIEFSRPWDRAKLWWPHDPHLYRLRTTLEPAGRDRPGDACETRFGFRQIRVDGYDFRFNEKRFKARMRAGIPDGRGTHSDSFVYYQRHLKQLADKGQVGPPLVRIHAALPADALLDVADEMGVLLEVDGPLGSVTSDWTSPQMWANYKAMVTDWFERDRNHPSVLFWAIENELLLCTNSQPTYFDSNRKNLLALGEHARRLDPTRPILFEGDGDIDGTWDTMALHYPRFWWVRTELPNDAFWLKRGAVDMYNDIPYPLAISWDKPKPIYMGEDGLYIEAYPPHDMAVIGGDAVYEAMFEEKTPWGPKSEQFNARGHAMYVEGYRDSEVAVTSTTLGGTGGPATDRAHLPVRSFVRQRNSRFYSGAKVERNINLHHDMLQDAKVRFEWSLMNGESVIQQGVREYEMEAGDLRRFEIELQMPDAAAPTPLKFHTKVMRDGEQLFAEVHDYTVYPPCKLTLSDDVRVGIFDRTRKAAHFFKEQSVGFVEYSTVESVGGWNVMHDLKHLNCLLIGEEGFDMARLPRLGPAVEEYLQQGGVVVCLRQRQGLDYLCSAEPLSQDLARRTTISWCRDRQHPVLAGISDDMLRYWSEDNIVSSGDFKKAARRGWRPIVDSGGLLEGLQWTSLVEMPVGKGAVVFCQMHLIDKVRDEPAAMLMLQNLLNYAAKREPGAAMAMQAIGGEGSAAIKRLGELGFQWGDDVAAAMIFVDAEADVVDADIASLAGAMQEGRTVLLHGLAPANIDRWRALLPADIELESADATYAARAAEHSLLAGMSGTDLWWGSFNIWGFAPQGGIEIAHSVKVGPSGEQLVKAGGLVIVPVGQGRLMIDQLLWERQDVHRERSGQYITLLLQNLLRVHD